MPRVQVKASLLEGRGPFTERLYNLTRDSGETCVERVTTYDGPGRMLQLCSNHQCVVLSQRMERACNKGVDSDSQSIISS